MKFQGNRDIHFSVLLLEVQQSQFGTRNTEFGGDGGMKSSHLCVFSYFKFLIFLIHKRI